MILAMSLAASGAAAESEWGLVLNGKSVHVDAARDWNESNWGLGFELEFEPEARWVKVAVGSAFRDSQNNISYLVGGGIKRRYRFPRLNDNLYFDIGGVGFMMTREDIDHNRPFPGLLPTFTLGSRHVAVNFSYLPGSAAHKVSGVRALDPSLDGIYFIQLRLDAGLFAPKGRRRAIFADNNSE